VGKIKKYKQSKAISENNQSDRSHVYKTKKIGGGVYIGRGNVTYNILSAGNKKISNIVLSKYQKKLKIVLEDDSFDKNNPKPIYVNPLSIKTKKLASYLVVPKIQDSGGDFKGIDSNSKRVNNYLEFLNQKQ
jgi:hypothetical protein